MVPASGFQKQAFGSSSAPVLVWFDGGGFTVGYKTEWPPTDLLKRCYGSDTEGLILVAVNYRVSALVGNDRLMR